MANKKKDIKKAKVSCSLNGKLIEQLDTYLEKEEIFKRSRYIENLIKEDLAKRGITFENKF